ncbi:MAG: hypothetical protein P9M04_03795 [Candidatus Orphnella occulta]|nr:hypothetical protein [Candidatus Orphnella occulta]
MEAVREDIPGIAPKDIKAWIRRHFEDGQIALAVKIAAHATGKIKLPKKIRQVFSTLNISDLDSGYLQLLSLHVIAYALRHDSIDDIRTILPRLKSDNQILHLMSRLLFEEGEETIVKEIFDQKGIGSFRQLHNKVYPHIFADLLPDDLSVSSKRVSAVLNCITRFKTSRFARDDLTIEEIYDQYRKDYKAGNIAPLPKGLPDMRIIEVSTKSPQSITDDAKKYYIDLMESAREALFVVNSRSGNPSLTHNYVSVELLKSIQQRINYLETVQTREGLPKSAKDAKKRQIASLKEAAAVIDVSIKDKRPCFDLLNLKHINTIDRINGISHVLRISLFLSAFEKSAVWKKYFEKPANQHVSDINIKEFVNFVDSFAKPHLMGSIKKDLRRLLLGHMNIKIFKEEITRLGQAGDTFKRRIRIYPARGWIAEFIGYYSDECWTRTRNIMRDNPDAIALVFADDVTGTLLGGTLLMPNSVNGRGVLIDRGLSPRTGVTARLNTEEFVNKVADYEEEIAKSLRKEMIVIPLRSLEDGLGTNNPDIIEHYKRTLSASNPVNFDRKNRFNDHDITKGQCVILREFPLKKNSLFDKSLDVDSLMPVKHDLAVLKKAILSAA